MKLRARFTLWFGLAALVPIAAAALITRSIVSGALREDADRAHAASTKEMRRLLSTLETDVQTRVAGLATADSSYAGGTLLELQIHGGTLPAQSRRRLAESGRTLMRQLALDFLVLLDGRGRVLDAPHDAAVLGELRPTLADVASKSSGASFYAMETLVRGGVLHKTLVVESARVLRDDIANAEWVAVAAGRRIDASLFESIRKFEGVRLRVITALGEQVVSPRGTWNASLGITSFPLLGSEGQTLARVEMSIVNNTLPSVLATVTLYSGVLAVAALVLTLMLGFVVSKRMTRDLDLLVAGAHAVARGELGMPVQTRSDDEVGEVAAALNKMMRDLADSKERLVMAERIAAWQEIARRLAHEIKNPLTPIQMAMETLRKTYKKKHPSFDEIFEESTATVLEEAGRLKRIVAEFSEFARMPNPHKVALDLGELVGSQLALYAGGSVEKHLQDALPPVKADRDSICQLLLNLVENARDATAGMEDASVVVTLERTASGEAIAMHIDDNGPGVAAESREKLFTPYYTTKHAHGGTGLGLAIAHRIVCDHLGRISVGDSPLGGARFTVEIPVSAAEMP